MSMYASTQIILVVMVVTYVVAKVSRVSTELSMFAAALAGAIAGGFGIPARHIVEGAFTYLDIVLIFVTATLFMNTFKESGGVAYIGHGGFGRLLDPRARASDLTQAIEAGPVPPTQPIRAGPGPCRALGILRLLLRHTGLPDYAPGGASKG